MLEVTLNKTITCPIDKKFAVKIASAAARLEKKIRGEVEINVVGDEEIKKLNRQYRGKNKPTDVLSFGWEENFPDGKKKILGQIFICYPQIVRQSKKFAVPVKEEFARMLSHGLLHLVGYDHVKAVEAEKMFKLQEEIVGKITVRKRNKQVRNKK